MMTSRLKLVSFPLCPFVQRAMITLLHHDMDFEIEYIDLFNPPEWFARISPLQKVPLLMVGDTLIFESAVINEYVDALAAEPLMPKDPLRAAQHKAWVEFSSQLIMDHYALCSAQDYQGFAENRQKLIRQFQQLQKVLGDGPFFDGTGLSLVDTAIAPLFMRIRILEERYSLQLFDNGSPLQAWSDALLALPSVKHSVPADFQQMYSEFVCSLQGHYSQYLQVDKMFKPDEKITLSQSLDR